MTFAHVFGEVGFVAKLDVSDLNQSTSWYEEKLGLEHDKNFDAATWAQLNIPGVRRVAVGLSQTGQVETGGSVPTFVVKDIESARQRLIEREVTVGPIEDVGEGISMAFFQDPDGNHLALRQNGPSHPGPTEVGAAT